MKRTLFVCLLVFLCLLPLSCTAGKPEDPFSFREENYSCRFTLNAGDGFLSDGALSVENGIARIVLNGDVYETDGETVTMLLPENERVPIPQEPGGGILLPLYACFFPDPSRVTGAGSEGITVLTAYGELTAAFGENGDPCRFSLSGGKNELKIGITGFIKQKRT